MADQEEVTVFEEFMQSLNEGGEVEAGSALNPVDEDITRGSAWEEIKERERGVMGFLEGF